MGPAALWLCYVIIALQLQALRWSPYLRHRYAMAEAAETRAYKRRMKELAAQGCSET
jgi:heme exporter protein D